MAKTKMHAVDGRPGELVSTEEALARAAITCFAARGFAATSIQDIATQAGVSKGNIYHYFSSKDEVLRLIVHRVLDDLSVAYASIPYEELTFAEQLRAFMDTMVAWVAENPEQTAIFVQERRLFSEAFADLVERTDQTVTMLANVLERGIAEGQIRPLVSPRTMALGLIGMATWVYQWYEPGRSSPDKISEMYATVVLDGLCLNRPPRSKAAWRRPSTPTDLNGSGSSTRETLIRAAMEQFVHRGYANTSIAMMAKGAGVTTGAFYSQFASKDEMLHTIMGRFLDRLCASMDDALEQELPAPEKLARLIVAIFGEVGDHQTELTIFLQEFRFLETEAFADLRLKSAETVAKFASVLSAGAEDGAFRKVFSREAMADGLLGLCAFPFQWMAPGEQVPDGTAEMFAEVVLAGLLPRNRRR